MTNRYRLYIVLFVLPWLQVVWSLVDQKATNETKNLYYRLRALARDENKIVFGMQSATKMGAEGGHAPYDLKPHNGIQGWMYSEHQADLKSPDDLSDVKRLTGSYPAMLGLDFSDLADSNLKVIAFLGKKAYERGEIVTLSMHHPNPVTGGSAWIDKDKGNYYKTIKRLLPGSDFNYKWRQILDKIAAWAHDFKDAQGKPIPAIFRFLHELNGGWFYWGLNNAVKNTENELKEFYRYTVKYLRDTKGVHQFLYAYSPDKFQDEQDYLKAYAGDDYVDILGMDYYYVHAGDTTDMFQRSVRDVVNMAEVRDKIPAITEVGIFKNQITKVPNFWNDHILDVVKKENATRRIGYVHAWANACYNPPVCQEWVPYRGHPGASSFLNNFYKDPITIFQNNIPNFYH